MTKIKFRLKSKEYENLKIASECENPLVKVELTAAAILPAKLEKYFDKLARRYGLTTDDVFNACFEVGFDNVPEWLAKRSEVKP